MSNSNSTSSRGGIGFPGLLAIVFIVLKLAGVIAWSWLWVLAPLWGGAILWGLAVIVLVLVASAASTSGARWRR